MAEREALRARVTGVVIDHAGPMVTLRVDGAGFDMLGRLLGAELAITVSPTRDPVRHGKTMQLEGYPVRVVGGPLLISDQMHWQVKPVVGDAEWVAESRLGVWRG